MHIDNLKFNYNDLVIGVGTGYTTTKILNWYVEEIICGQLYLAKQYDYLGNELDKDHKIQIIFETEDGEHELFFEENGLLVDIIYEELRLNLKLQKGVSC